MCGIAGVIGIGKYSEDVRGMLKQISHRGPDAVGEFSDGKVSLGFRRLSIIDLSENGNQPMCNEYGTVWVVFNGEIYNYKELKKELSKNHKFTSNADTEVLVHGYEEWGIEGLLDRIDGMFAVCIYDKKKGICYLMRDRIGKKPLYFYVGERSLVFASEAKAFFTLKDFAFKVDTDVFNLWMGFPYVADNNKTLIEGVFKVPPAHYVRINVETGTATFPKKYWEPRTVGFKGSFDDAVRSMESALVASVAERLVADVPVGVLLSGGLDSSLITAIASKNSKDKIKTITISFGDSGIDESRYAQIVSDYCNTDHFNLRLKVSDVYEEFRKTISLYDDLSTVDGGLFSVYLLSKEVRKLGVKVVLVGEGADEIFGGYSWFGFSKYPFKVLPSFVKSFGYYYAIMRVFNGKFARYPRILDYKLNEFGGDYFKKMQHYELGYSLPNHYCMKLDKGSMGASIEARTPFLDYKVVSMALNMPERFLLRGEFYNPRKSNEKYILRKISEKYLPFEIYSRKKRGGMLPTRSILSEGLSKDAKLILENKHLLEFFGKNYLYDMIKSRPNNIFSTWQREWILWKCLVFSLWFDYVSNIRNYEKE